jgi:hypothetical protein
MIDLKSKIETVLVKTINNYAGLFCEPYSSWKHIVTEVGK